MKKLAKTVRCFGQDFDSGELCPERNDCARFVDLQSEHEIEDVRIASIHRKDGEEKCGKRIQK